MGAAPADGLLIMMHGCAACAGDFILTHFPFGVFGWHRRTAVTTGEFLAKLCTFYGVGVGDILEYDPNGILASSLPPAMATAGSG